MRKNLHGEVEGGGDLADKDMQPLLVRGSFDPHPRSTLYHQHHHRERPSGSMSRMSNGPTKHLKL